MLWYVYYNGLGALHIISKTADIGFTLIIHPLIFLLKGSNKHNVFHEAIQSSN